MISFLFSLALSVLIYAMVLASFDPWDLLMGTALSAALLLGFRRFLESEGPARPGDSMTRILAFFPFVGAVIWDILVGAWTVVQIVLKIRPLTHPGIVAVPIEDRTPLGVAVSALATTLSPGTFLVDVDWDRRVMLIHAIDASDPEAVREAHHLFYQRWQRRVFP